MADSRRQWIAANMRSGDSLEDEEPSCSLTTELPDETAKDDKDDKNAKDPKDPTDPILEKEVRPDDEWIRNNVTAGLQYQGGPPKSSRKRLSLSSLPREPQSNFPKRRRVSLPPEPTALLPSMTPLTSVTHEGLTYTVGQDVCVDGYYDRGESGTSGAVVDAIPWYARIRNIYLVGGCTPDVTITLQWWYRPQDLPLYRRHGVGELYFSHHWESGHPVSCLKYPIEVVSEDEVCDEDLLGHYVFYSTTCFLHKKGKFKPLSPTTKILRRGAIPLWQTSSRKEADLPTIPGLLGDR